MVVIQVAGRELTEIGIGVLRVCLVDVVRRIPFVHHPSCCARLEDTEPTEVEETSWSFISVRSANELK